MNGHTDDPGDDVREYRLQQAERDAAPWSWQAKVSLALAIAGPLAVVVAARIWFPS